MRNFVAFNRYYINFFQQSGAWPMLATFVLRAMVSWLAFAAVANASALLPVEVSQAGSFPWATGKYEIAISLDRESGALASFRLIVDERRIPISLDEFDELDRLDLSSLQVVFARNAWLGDTIDDLVIGPFSVLSISINAAMDACKSGYADLRIAVDTLDDYSWTLRHYCLDDDE
ncbi:MAG: hypothetical protein AAFX44_18105 [Pseudomonadota bacterium]